MLAAAKTYSDFRVERSTYEMELRIKALQEIVKRQQSEISDLETKLNLERAENNSLRRQIPAFKTNITPEEIRNIVCEFTGVSERQICCKSRTRKYSEARQMAACLITEFTKASLQQIADLLGKRCHTTMVHARKTAYDLYDTDPVFRANIDQMRFILQQNVNNIIEGKEKKTG